MDVADLQELFAALGDITVKRLFSGKGIYHRGLIVGALMDGDVLLKGDAESGPEFEAAGAARWTYTYPDGRTISMPYWSLPAEAVDDPERAAVWVQRAYAAALRSSTVKRPKTARKRS